MATVVNVDEMTGPDKAEFSQAACWVVIPKATAIDGELLSVVLSRAVGKIDTAIETESEIDGLIPETDVTVEDCGRPISPALLLAYGAVELVLDSVVNGGVGLVPLAEPEHGGRQ